MSTETQPAGNCPVDVTFGPVAEALRLAEYVSQHGCGDTAAVSAELRRLHALRIELQTQLEDLMAERAFFKMQSNDAKAHAYRMAMAPPGACPSCYGDGEQGGQFCGGVWPCESCGGTGKAVGAV
jgi:hypothetical protein